MPKAESTPKKYHQTSHGPEIFPRRPPVLTSVEKEWRETVVAFLLERLRAAPANLSLAPKPATIKESPATYRVRDDASLEPVSLQLDESEASLRERLTEEVLVPLRIINEILKVQFGSPELGNQKNLIDELIYILLTRRSKIEDAQKHLSALKKKYLTWEEVAFAPTEELKATIMGGGLEDHKVKFIQSSLQFIHERFGRIDEADFACMSDWELDQFLQELPGVGKKTSACILMYARSVDIFPADTHCIRVLDRLGIFKNFGLAWRQEDHKKAQNELPLLLMPPHIRGDLHRNLVVLGKEICKQTPECHRCELKKFCAYYRDEAQSAYKEEKKSLTIEMFCGAGGFSLGLSRAGFKIVAAIDNNPNAIRTYRLNHPEMPNEAVIEGDAHQVDLDKLRYLLGDRKLDLLAGGPPCQGFSMMGNRVPHKFENGNKKFGSDYNFAEDKRNHLFEAIITVAEKLQPRYVVIENVPGLGSAEIEEQSYADHIAEWLQVLNYQTQVVRLEATNFGVPQKRHRYFIFGIGQGEQPLALEKLKNKTLPVDKRAKLKHALYDLPRLHPSDGNWIRAYPKDIEHTLELYRQYLGKFNIRGNSCLLFNHVSRFNNQDDIDLYSNLMQGETYRQLVERLIEQFGQKPSFTKYDTKNFRDKYYRLEWEGQSKTIVSHLHKDGNSFVHPLQNRSLTVREAARIQSFPDDYIFCGSRGAQFIQIGNAVPPVMAEAIGKILIEALANVKKLDK
jgi:DNA (cytosine-5)-methyltransferase 1